MNALRLRGAAPYAVLLIGAAALYGLASQITYSAGPGEIGPDFWPKVAIVLIAVVCTVELLKAIFSGGNAETLGIADRLDQSEDDEDAPRQPILLATGIAMTVGYGTLIGLLGFPLTTFLFLVSFMYVGGFRAHSAIWLSSLAGSVALTLLFLRVVYVSLPRGIPPFDGVTDLLTALF